MSLCTRSRPRPRAPLRAPRRRRWADGRARAARPRVAGADLGDDAVDERDCGLDDCPLPFGHDGPCLKRPPRQVNIVYGIGPPAEIPVHAHIIPIESRGLARVRWTVRVEVEEDTSS